MIPSTREIQHQQTKKEESAPNGTSKFGNTKTMLSSSRQWSAFRNPRIVRVPRSFGGKDRHSKVCTVRGLRDRRIRLSVPTAIQLYDLQERLELSQPSKVIDWLMDSTKDDIDKLPPLQLPQGSFGQFVQQSVIGGAASSRNDQIADPNSNLPLYFDGNSGFFSSKDTGININNNKARLQDQEIVGDHKSKYWDYLDAASKAKSKEVERDNELNQAEKVRWLEMNNQHGNHFQGLLRGYNNNQVSAQNFFPVASDSPYNPYNQKWDPTSTLKLAQLENCGITSSSYQPSNDHNNCSLLSASSSSTFGALIPSGGPQLFFCPPPTSTFFPVATSSYPPYSTMSLEAADPRQINSHFHLFNPSSSTKTFQLNNANSNKLLQFHSQDEDSSTS